MAFDQPTRNRLARFVGDARALLTDEFTRQLQNDYGMDPSSGDVADMERLTHLDNARRETAGLLRATLDHYLAGSSTKGAKATQEALDRIVREQAFTVLNRLCALRMAESRELLIESIGKGYQSKGFQLYARLAGAALGETGAAYRSYVFSVFDEFAISLPVLFDRFSPQGRLFPREAVLLQLLDLINHPDIEALWAEDETIGWIYQYFNSKEERKAMRDASQAPRNSRELAVRNQFFTPRYVVEFLTDNTLGRIWYEMTQGETDMKNSCRYLVRRPIEVFLPETGFEGENFGYQSHELIFDEGWRRLPDDLPIEDILHVGLAIDGYDERMLRPLSINNPDQPVIAVGDLANARLDEYAKTGVWRGNSLELWLCLFFEQRRHHHFGPLPEGKAADIVRALYHAWRGALQRESEETDQTALLRQPVYIKPRPQKDPRDIKMLDPACGSMHFGLYAFDLFERIYEETWDMYAKSHRLEEELLTKAYATKEAFMRDVPRLIIEHNIHGIDIDPRAVQIAGLSLWLRAQRSWQTQGVRAQDRPDIKRSNIVCAEPMPGEVAFLDEFIKQKLGATPEGRLLGQLVRRVFDAMKLAGEAGSLLKIEEEIAVPLTEAKDRWLAAGNTLEQVPMFGDTTPKQLAMGLDVRGITDEGFWDRAEGLIYTALRAYVEQAEGGSYQRRLFADDAARGFAFIDLCRKRYDLVLMNPPFGSPSHGSGQHLSKTYPFMWSDIYAAFIQRGYSLLYDAGRLGAITSRTFLALYSFSQLRELLLSAMPIQYVVECGLGVLDDATVRAAFFVAERSKHVDRVAIFVDLRASTDRAHDLWNSYFAGKGFESCFSVPLSGFEHIPGKPFAYWLPFQLTQLLGSGPYLDAIRLGQNSGDSVAHVAVGASTADDMRFVRCHWEVLPSQIGTSEWARFAHAIGFTRYYSPTYAVLNWFSDGREFLSVTDELGNVKARLRGKEYFFKPGLISPYISERGLGCSYLAVDHIVGHSCKSYQDLRCNGDVLLAYLNSALVDLFTWALTPDRKHEAGIISALPIPGRLTDTATASRLAQLSRICWESILALRRVEECDPLYFPPPKDWAGCYKLNKTKYLAAQCEVDNIVSSLVLNPVRITQIIKTSGAPHDLDAWGYAFNDGNVQEIDEEPQSQDKEYLQSLLSHYLGCIFGRWDISYATGEKQSPELPDPFAPLPICPPVMLQNERGLPAAPTDVPTSYPLRITWQGILVDDTGHPEDIEHRIHEALHVIWQDSADAIEQEACGILGVKTLRDYFRKPAGFFADHLSRYSKSRRQAPIYWPLSTLSNSYTLWLYYHRLNNDTLYTCVNNFVDPKIKQVASDVSGLRQKTNRSTADEKELERLMDFEHELTEFRAELLRIAAFWKPNLNDGVQITAAPLWKLFQHRPWQKKLKETWQSLEAGDYDWAHLAYSIWPERVREKCRDDKSLAIAHDLEHLYVEPQGAAKKKTGKKKLVVEDEDLGMVMDE